ncbi:MAG: ComEC/Rec2 family competence protein [Leptolyngbyaceae cyanobacterium]
MAKFSFGLVLCVAYLAGLLLSPIAAVAISETWAMPGAGLVGCICLMLWGVIAPRRLRLGWRSWQWGCLGVVVLLAATYLIVRTPTAGPQDISRLVSRAQAIAPDHVIVGRLIEEPRLNREVKSRFSVAVEQLQVLDAVGEITFQTPARGRVYMTAPLLQTTGLHQGYAIKAKGRLYLPAPATNPHGFDFQAYLRQREIFAGFVAAEIHYREQPYGGLWRIRQRIVRAQVRALGSPLGQLVSAMSLGRRAVDLPSDIQDLFARVGLAHTVAASGFHVTLLLGTVLALLRSQPGRTQGIVGAAVLLGYVTLTGIQPSVVRAAMMGSASLVSLATQRKVIPSGALIVAATVMLLVHPIWIWDIGFQLSFVATWGLIVTAPRITQWLDWLPTTLASLVAVPIAATVWTLPITLFHFNVFSSLSIGLNVITVPLVTVISLGGICSSAVTLVAPFLGELLANLLYYPAQLLLTLAQISNSLPGSSIAIGQIQLWQVAALYVVLSLTLRSAPQMRMGLKPWLVIAFVAVIIGPIGWRWFYQDQITLLAAGDELILVQQYRGHTTVINSGDSKTAFYTVMPFLTQAGVNQIDEAIALSLNADTDYQAGWQTLASRIPTQHMYNRGGTKLAGLSSQRHDLEAGVTSNLAHLTVQLLGIEHPVVRLSHQESWLLLPPLSKELQQYLAAAGSVLQSDVLVMSGDELSPELLAMVSPHTIICYGYTFRAAIERDLQQAGIQTFWTHRDGAVIWSTNQGFHGYVETKHRNVMPWG